MEVLGQVRYADEPPANTSDKEEDAEEDQDGLSPVVLRARLEREIPLNECCVFGFVYKGDFFGTTTVLVSTEPLISLFLTPLIFQLHPLKTRLVFETTIVKIDGTQAWRILGDEIFSILQIMASIFFAANFPS